MNIMGSLCNGTYLILLTLSTCAHVVFSQLPVTSLYLLNIQEDGKDLSLSKPTYLSSFNPNGYNNQPFFISDSELLFTSDADSPGVTDIFHADIRRGILSNITKSGSAEYSPQLSLDKEHLLMIKVDEEGKQYLAKADWPTVKEITYLFPDLDNVGYYLEFSADTFVAFLVASPVELWALPVSGKTRRGLSRNIGRCIQRYNANEILYVHKLSPEKWTLRTMHIGEGVSGYISDMPKGVEDFVLLKGGRVLCADKSAIYLLDPKAYGSNKWKLLMDLSFLKVGIITRMAVNESQSQIVLVGQ